MSALRCDGLNLCVEATLDASTLVLLVDAFGDHAVKNWRGFAESI